MRKFSVQQQQHVTNTDLDESLDLVHNHRLVAELHKRLGQSESKGAQASAKAYFKNKHSVRSATAGAKGPERRRSKRLTTDKNQSLHVECGRSGKGVWTGQELHHSGVSLCSFTHTHKHTVKSPRGCVERRCKLSKSKPEQEGEHQSTTRVGWSRPTRGWTAQRPLVYINSTQRTARATHSGTVLEGNDAKYTQMDAW